MYETRVIFTDICREEMAIHLCLTRGENGEFDALQCLHTLNLKRDCCRYPSVRIGSRASVHCLFAGEHSISDLENGCYISLVEKIRLIMSDSKCCDLFDCVKLWEWSRVRVQSPAQSWDRVATGKTGDVDICTLKDRYCRCNG